jgi:hypothetical protein
MSRKTCLRCDWDGETAEPTCPRCGTRSLYLLGAPPSAPSGDPVEHPARRPTAPPDDAPRRSPPSLAALVVAVSVLVAGGIIWLVGNDGRSPQIATEKGGGGTSASGLGATSVPSPSPALERAGVASRLPVGRHELTVEGVALSFLVPGNGWERVGSLYLSKSSVGPQGAEAIIYWTIIDGGRFAKPCGQWWGAPPGSALDYAVSASGYPGTQLVTRPMRATVGGLPGSYVAFTLRRGVGCAPGFGFFYRWRPVDDGAFWTGTQAGDTVRVWIVDVGETRLYIEGAMHADASRDLERELQHIVGSIRFG